jgi:hypothetical protein
MSSATRSTGRSILSAPSEATEVGRQRARRMTKYDIKRDPRYAYRAKNRTWELVEVPRQQFIAIDGHGDPNTSAGYAAAVEALFSVAYTIKFASKNSLDRDYAVGPLEGLWWADDPTVFLTRDKDAWDWRFLIAQPEWITEDLIEEGRQSALAKKGLPAIEQVHHYVLGLSTPNSPVSLNPASPTSDSSSSGRWRQAVVNRPGWASGSGLR